jgi:hypothetical protein
MADSIGTAGWSYNWVRNSKHMGSSKIWGLFFLETFFGRVRGNTYLCRMDTPKFKVGDKVKVVKYGHIIHHYKSETGNWAAEDISPDIVGKEGVVREVSNSQPGWVTYALDGIPEKTAWYNQNQLELV